MEPPTSLSQGLVYNIRGVVKRPLKNGSEDETDSGVSQMKRLKPPPLSSCPPTPPVATHHSNFSPAVAGLNNQLKRDMNEVVPPLGQRDSDVKVKQNMSLPLLIWATI